MANLCDINSKNGNGETPLSIAVVNGLTDIVKLLLSKKANCKNLDKNRKLISKLGNIKDKSGCTPLHYAIYLNDQKMVELLLKHGANPNVFSKKGLYPIHMASRISLNLCRLLVQYGANVNVKDVNGRTPIMESILSKCGEAFQICIFLKENGASINGKDIFGNSTLHYASSAGKLQLVDFLIKNGANIDEENYQGETPFIS